MDYKQYFVLECLKLARQMSLREARDFLRGMLEMLGECPEAHEIHLAYAHIDESDRQLELLTTKS